VSQATWVQYSIFKLKFHHQRHLCGYAGRAAEAFHEMKTSIGAIAFVVGWFL
jgi:hypothetical protein